MAKNKKERKQNKKAKYENKKDEKQQTNVKSIMNKFKESLKVESSGNTRKLTQEELSSLEKQNKMSEERIKAQEAERNRMEKMHEAMRKVENDDYGFKIDADTLKIFSEMEKAEEEKKRRLRNQELLQKRKINNIRYDMQEDR